MTNDDAQIFRLALLHLEETANEVITHYIAAHGPITDGGERLIAALGRTLAERTRQLIEDGEGVRLLASWRRKAALN